MKKSRTKSNCRLQKLSNTFVPSLETLYHLGCLLRTSFYHSKPQMVNGT